MAQKYYSHAGISDTVAGWSRRTGVHAQTIRARLLNNWTFAQAIGSAIPPVERRGRPSRKHLFDGEFYTIKQLARKIGVAYPTLHQKMQGGDDWKAWAREKLSSKS